VKAVAETAGTAVATTVYAAGDTATTANGAVVGTVKTGTNTVGTVVTAGKVGVQAAQDAVAKSSPSPAK
jgi:hypothetical protein